MPITLVQVKLGTQVVGSVAGQELRDMGGLYFSMPRTPGSYNFNLFATDTAGCVGATTAVRTIVVQ